MDTTVFVLSLVLILINFVAFASIVDLVRDLRAGRRPNTEKNDLGSAIFMLVYITSHLIVCTYVVAYIFF